MLPHTGRAIGLTWRMRKSASTKWILESARGLRGAIACAFCGVDSQPGHFEVSLDASDQLARTERFDQIVNGPGVHPSTRLSSPARADSIIRGVSRISFVGPYLAQRTEPVQRGIITSVRGRFKDRQSNAQSRLFGTSNHCRFGRFESTESCPA